MVKKINLLNYRGDVKPKEAMQWLKNIKVRLNERQPALVQDDIGAVEMEQ